MNIIRCPEQALGADFGDIVIGNIIEKMDFIVTLHQEVILIETYFPDREGNVYIRDMHLLSETYRQENALSADITSDVGTITFNLEFREFGQTITRNVKIYTGDVETAGALTPDTLIKIPLTRCFNKTVCPDQKEYISFYGGGNISLLVVYTDVVSDRSVMFDFATLPGDPDTISRFDVSPTVVAQLAGIEQWRIVYYILYKESAYRIKYTLNKYLRPEKTFVFRNAFGAQETFTCLGDSESNREWIREFGTIHRGQHLTNREMKETYTVHTGYLTREETNVVEDLLNSRQISQMNEYGWRPVTIQEETFVVQSRRDELISVEFKYQPTKNNHLQYSFQPVGYRIFDFTFDDIFN
jgi:hypothetical protein